VRALSERTKSKVSPGYITKLEKGSREAPRDYVIEALEAALGLAPGHLLNGEQAAAPSDAAPIETTLEVEHAVQHVRKELVRALSSATPEQKQEIVDHLLRQVTLLADLAAPTKSARAPDRQGVARHR
jgi:transcriptional regulator with XRE-family HTH domain